MKHISLPVAVGVAILGCVLAVYANVSSSNLGAALDQERYKRLKAEQYLQKSQGQVKALQSELGEAKSKIASIEKILSDGKQMAKELAAAKQESVNLQEQLKTVKAQAAQQAEATAAAAAPQQQ